MLQFYLTFLCNTLRLAFGNKNWRNWIKDEINFFSKFLISVVNFLVRCKMLHFKRGDNLNIGNVSEFRCTNQGILYTQEGYGTICAVVNQLWAWQFIAVQIQFSLYYSWQLHIWYHSLPVLSWLIIHSPGYIWMYTM